MEAMPFSLLPLLVHLDGLARQQLVDFQEVGYGSAASTFLFLVIAMLTVTAIRLARLRLEEGAAR